MSEIESKVSVSCAKCGATFTAFLQQMADHNGKVVCPKCGYVHPRPRSGIPHPSKSKP